MNKNGSSTSIDIPTSQTDPPNSDSESGANNKSQCPADERQEAENITEVPDRPTSYPTDRANFPVDLSDASEKRAILKMTPCKPEGPFPLDKNGRCFSKDYYFKRSKISRVPRKWLCYSPIMDRAYCEPCWLFANRRCPSHHPSWTVGINDWQGLSGKIKKHESSHAHIALPLPLMHKLTANTRER